MKIPLKKEHKEMIPKDPPEKYPSMISILMSYCEVLTYSLGFFTL